MNNNTKDSWHPYWELIATATCQTCKKEGGVLYVLNRNRFSRSGDVTLLCRRCFNGQKRLFSRSFFQNQEEKARKRQKFFSSALCPRLLD